MDNDTFIIKGVLLQLQFQKTFQHELGLTSFNSPFNKKFGLNPKKGDEIIWAVFAFLFSPSV